MKQITFKIHMQDGEIINAGCDPVTFERLKEDLKVNNFDTYLEIKNLGILINANHIEFIREYTSKD